MKIGNYKNEGLETRGKEIDDKYVQKKVLRKAEEKVRSKESHQIMQVLDDLRLGIHHKVNDDAPRYPLQSVRRRVRDDEVESGRRYSLSISKTRIVHRASASPWLRTHAKSVGEKNKCAISECQSEPRRHSLRGARERNSIYDVTHLAQVLIGVKSQSLITLYFSQLLKHQKPYIGIRMVAERSSSRK